MSKAIDLKGNIYGDLTVISRNGTHKTHAVWKVSCGICGSHSDITATNLKSGNSTRCNDCRKKKIKKNILTGKDKEKIKEDSNFCSMETLSKDYGVAKTTIFNIIHA